ncbi:hypothetical protein BGZ80_001667 [Entomortierella chlamydospora]|uniref:Galactose oxidase n=1 Tax=Entomortierella chlamydospora TaxID=101097 RepID=A0A9P6MQW9_9FUNG|nr:hypothetical protein BGZ79_009007 [Entomortierella chlamydospora]KAG0010210.1 hypothetical protein BGZ80_001667 [Entomortierella chlamydospora]
MAHASPCQGAPFHHEPITRRYRSYPKTYTYTHLTLLFLGCITALVAAQPKAVAYMAYASIDEKTFYIHGGEENKTGPGLNQFFSLDLTQSGWNASNPPWKAISLGSGGVASPVDYQHSMTVSKDKQSLIIWGRASGLSVYHIPNDTWISTTALPQGSTLQPEGLHAVTDPTTGLIYVPSGANDAQSMMQYDPSNPTVAAVLPMPSTLSDPVRKLGVSYYSSVWSTQRNSMLMYGGGIFEPPGIDDIAKPFFFEYIPSNKSWIERTVIGDSPGEMISHCMIPAYNGTKIVVFGGGNIHAIADGSLYVIDVATLKWTKVTTISPSQYRGYTSCTVSGDNFIAWGGEQDTSTTGDGAIFGFGTPVIYNMKTNLWTTQYIASFSNPGATGTSSGSSESPNPTTPIDGSSSTNKSSNAPIIGGAVAAVAVLAVAIFFVYRRRSRSVERRHSHNDSKTSLSAPPKNNQDLELNNVRRTVLNSADRRARAPEDVQSSTIQVPEDQMYSVNISVWDNSTVVGSPIPRYQKTQLGESSTIYTPTELSPGSPHTAVGALGPQFTPTLRSPQGTQPLEPNSNTYSTYSNSTLAEEQIAQIKAHHEQQYKHQQEYLEHLRQQQQSQLEALKLKLTIPNRDANADNTFP